MQEIRVDLWVRRSWRSGNGKPLQDSAWQIPQTEDCGLLQSMWSQTVRHVWSILVPMHIVCNILGLGYFNQHNFLRFIQVWYMYQHGTFYCWIAFYGMKVTTPCSTSHMLKDMRFVSNFWLLQTKQYKNTFVYTFFVCEHHSSFLSVINA